MVDSLAIQMADTTAALKEVKTAADWGVLWAE